MTKLKAPLALVLTLFAVAAHADPLGVYRKPLSICPVKCDPVGARCSMVSKEGDEAYVYDKGSEKGWVLRLVNANGAKITKVTADGADKVKLEYTAKDGKSTGTSGSISVKVPTPTEIDEAAFRALIKVNGTHVVKFGAEFCGPCRRMAPVLERIAQRFDGEADVFLVDITKEPNLAKALNIQSIPTTIIIRDGKAESAMIGFRDESEVAKEIQAVLDK